MTTYRTSDIAKIIGVHPNTVRLYEKIGLIPYACRESNGYRVFTDFHLAQFKLARTAFEVEILQSGLRKMAVDIIKTSARREFVLALKQAGQYFERIRNEKKKAEETLVIVREQLQDKETEKVEKNLEMKRNETADYLGVTIDTLRNWEMNGLLSVKRNQNGYRIYNSKDIQRLKIIRSLRYANYSLSSILRMLNALTDDSEIDIEKVIDSPHSDDDIVSACDKLLTSLKKAEDNAQDLIEQLHELQGKYK